MTDDIEQIRARAESVGIWEFQNSEPFKTNAREAHKDRATLLSELDKARAEIERLRVIELTANSVYTIAMVEREGGTVANRLTREDELGEALNEANKWLTVMTDDIERCAHSRVLQGTEPGITGEGVQDYWYCEDCSERFCPEWRFNYVGKQLDKAKAEIERLRELISCVLAQPLEYADSERDRRILRNGLNALNGKS